MRAWRVAEWCGPEGLALEEIPLPQPGPGQVRVRVVAAALNFLDALMIAGRYQERPALPFTPGVELSGVVDAVGPDAHLSVGARVCGLTSPGGLAEYAAVPAADLYPVPEDLDLVTAAAVPVVYGTAHHALVERARIKATESVLVCAGAGGVGLAAVQLARAFGCRVYAAAGGPEKCALCEAEGAQAAFDYRAPDWVEAVKAATGGQGVNVVLDPVGGEATLGALRCLVFGGRLLIVGFASGTIPDIPANRVLLRNLAVLGVIWGAYRRRHPDAGTVVMEDLWRLWRAGSVRPHISARRPLVQAPAAIADLAARRTTGKVLLLP